MHFLVQPVRLFIAQRHVEVKQDAGKYKAHFVVGKAEYVSNVHDKEKEGTNFLPRQLRGPVEKGFRASRRSDAYSCVPSGRKRSGTKASGFVKLVGEWFIE